MSFSDLVIIIINKIIIYSYSLTCLDSNSLWKKTQGAEPESQ